MSLLALFAILQILTADLLLQTKPTNITIYTYPLLIFSSIIYLHWIVMQLFIPFKNMSQELIDEIKTNTNIRFFSGISGIGYLIALSPITFFVDAYPNTELFDKSDIPDSYVFRGAALVLVGVAFKSRTILKYIIDKKLKQKNPSNSDSDVPKPE